MITGNSGVGDGDARNSKLTEQQYSARLRETTERLRAERLAAEQQATEQQRAGDS